MAYSFERLPQVVNLRGKLPHNGWYKVYPESYKTDIAVHHSLTKTGSSRAFANYHVGTHKWPEVAYHFVILKDGTIEYNHQLGVLSYHVGNSNKQAVGICLVGDFRTEKPTAAQEHSFRELHACLVRDLPNYKRTRGHNEFPGYAWKQCPCFDYKAVLAGKSVAPAKPAAPKVVKSSADYSGKEFVVTYKGAEGVNIYDTADWGAKPYATYKHGTTRDIIAKYSVDGADMYKFRGGDGELYYITAHSKFVDVRKKAEDDGVKSQAPKPTNPTKEDEEMLKEAIVIGSYSDYPAAEVLANRLKAPIYTRTVAEGEEVAKHLYVVGGGKDGLKADKITNLSGKDRFETMKNVKEAK